jgi:hypothetical protein
VQAAISLLPFPSHRDRLPNKVQLMKMMLKVLDSMGRYLVKSVRQQRFVVFETVVFSSSSIVAIGEDRFVILMNKWSANPVFGQYFRLSL